MIASTDFEAPAYHPGVILGGEEPLHCNSNAGSTGLTIATSDRVQPFGPDNQFLLLNGSTKILNADDSSVGQPFMAWMKYAPIVSTYSFNYYEPSGQGGDLRFGLGQSDLNESRGYISWIVNDGRIRTGINTVLVSGSAPVLLEDRRYIVYVFYNVSGQAEPIQDLDVAPLSSEQCALYIKDTVTGDIIDGGRYAHTGNIKADTFIFRAFSSDTGQFFVDDIRVGDALSVHIPEPKFVAFFVGIVGLFGAAVKSRMRASCS